MMRVSQVLNFVRGELSAEELAPVLGVHAEAPLVLDAAVATLDLTAEEVLDLCRRSAAALNALQIGALARRIEATKGLPSAWYLAADTLHVLNEPFSGSLSEAI